MNELAHPGILEGFWKSVASIWGPQDEYVTTLGNISIEPFVLKVNLKLYYIYIYGSEMSPTVQMHDSGKCLVSKPRRYRPDDSNEKTRSSQNEKHKKESDSTL